MTEYPIPNPARRAAVHHRGVEERPVIVIDDGPAHPAGWRAAAAVGEQARVGPHCPGVRAFVDRDRADATRDERAPLLAETLALDPADDPVTGRLGVDGFLFDGARW